MSRRYFGTDGVRGPVGGALVNPEFFARLSAAATEWAKCAGRRKPPSLRPDAARVSGEPVPAAARDAADAASAVSAGTDSAPAPAAPSLPLRVLIGRDTRASGPELERGVVAGVRAAGGEPILLGILPTPAVARAVKTTGAALGVVITASHNPARDNGIKFFTAHGTKLTDADEAQIEALLPDSVPLADTADGALEAAVAAVTSAAPANLPRGETAPAALEIDASALAAYVAGHAALLPPRSLAGWRIAVDTANGATVRATPAVLRELGAEVIGLGDAPDGHNINAGLGSEHPERLAALLRDCGARLGVVHDGDGDRCILVDESGSVLDGDEILTILALDAQRRGALAGGTLVITVQSNLGVDVAIGAAGGRVLRTSVGDRYVSERMRAEGAILGGESSGHIICADVSPTGDGLVTALRVIDVMRRTGEPLSALRAALKKFPQKTSALPVNERRDLSECPALRAAISDWETKFAGRREQAASSGGVGAGGEPASAQNKTPREGETGEPAASDGRVMVRYSGTELKLRFLVEAPDEAVASAALAALEAAAHSDGLL